MRSSRRIALFAVVVAMFGVLVPAAHSAVNCTFNSGWGTNRSDLAQQVIDLTNQHRATLGLGPLASSPTLTASAVWKSGHMAEYGYFTHDDQAFAPLTTTRVWSDRVRRDCDYPGSGFGENIAAGYPTPQAVMTGWLDSSGHRANIENSSYRAIGVGVVVSAGGRIEWTQNFGSLVDSGSTPQPPVPQPPGPAPGPAPTPAPGPAPAPAPAPGPAPAPAPVNPPSAPPAAAPGETAPLGTSESSDATEPLAPARTSSLAVAGYKVRAAKVRAGKRFKARMVVRRKRGAATVKKLVVRCPAHLPGGRNLRVVSSKLRVVSGSRVQATCVWRIPKKAAGARLNAEVVVGFRGDSARISFGARVRRS